MQRWRIVLRDVRGMPTIRISASALAPIDPTIPESPFRFRDRRSRSIMTDCKDRLPDALHYN